MNTDGMVIVGASLAGAKAAEAARVQGWDSQIRLVGAEDHLPYARPALSKQILIGSEEPARADVHLGRFYATNEIDLILGTRALRIDLADRCVLLDGGRRLRFARLVLATGSSARALSVPGASLDGIQTLRTVDDAISLRDALMPGRRVAVIGGSWMGTEVAACARARGCDAVICEPRSTLLERALGREVGRFFDDLHRTHEVELRLGAGVERFVGSDRMEGVRLEDAATVGADVALVGVGARPDISLAVDAGLATNDGVLVDARLRTSHPDVFAAGDIAEAEHPRLGGRVRVAHWANAWCQGLTAGANAAGAAQVYDRIPYVFSEQYDLAMEYSGWPAPWDHVAFRGDPRDGAFVAFYLDGQRLVGGVNLNVAGVSEHIQRLIRDAAPVSVRELTDVDVDPAAWSAAGHS
jgi:3-phenylpropionate/trans-cinnamate dioxygenase ferredoxin reductase subunit